MSKRVAITPSWMDRALQGITFWIGHRRALYSGYALGEAALIAELCNMIYSHLEPNQLLRCEMQYTDLIGGSVEASVLSSKARADIVILKKTEKGEPPRPEYVIEVKRASSSTQQIENDMKRLAAVKKVNPDITTYLVVIAEAERPKRFVNQSGSAITSIYRIPECDHLYRVRRVFKATHTFKKADRAQYACLLEVSPKMDKARLARASYWHH